MALTERTEIDRQEILADGHIQVRTVTIIERDGVEVARAPNRYVIAPGDDVSGEDAEVRGIAAIMHTPARVAAYRARQARGPRR